MRNTSGIFKRYSEGKIEKKKILRNLVRNNDWNSFRIILKRNSLDIFLKFPCDWIPSMRIHGRKQDRLPGGFFRRTYEGKLMKLFYERFWEIPTKWLVEFLEKSSKEIQEKSFLKFIRECFWKNSGKRLQGVSAAFLENQSVYKLLVNIWRQSRKNRYLEISWSNYQMSFCRNNG